MFVILSAFLVYTLFVVLVSLVLIFYFGPRYGTKNPMVYIGITGMIGSLSVMGCKGFGVALKQTFAGDNQLNSWFTWFLVLGVACCITTQLNYMNKALDIFNTSVVTPILYVIFTTFVLIASAILFKEWGNMKPEDILGNICGFLTVICGIFLLQAFKDMHISAKDLTSVRRVDESGSNNSSSSNGSIPFHREDNTALLMAEEEHDLPPRHYPGRS